MKGLATRTMAPLHQGDLADQNDKNHHDVLPVSNLSTSSVSLLLSGSRLRHSSTKASERPPSGANRFEIHPTGWGPRGCASAAQLPLRESVPPARSEPSGQAGPVLFGRRGVSQRMMQSSVT